MDQRTDQNGSYFCPMHSGFVSLRQMPEVLGWIWCPKAHGSPCYDIWLATLCTLPSWRHSWSPLWQRQ